LFPQSWRTPSLEAVDRRLRSDWRHCELNLSTNVLSGCAHVLKDGGGQDVAADDREIGRSVLLLRFLHEPRDAVEPPIAAGSRLGGDDAVARNLFGWHPHHRQHRGPHPVVDLDHLPDAGDVASDEVVAKKNGEGLLAHERLRDRDRVPEAERLFLAHVGYVDEVGDGLHDSELLALALVFEKALELEGDVEVIFDRRFSAAGHQDDVLDSRVDGFFDHVLDEGLVDERQHLLRLRLRRREKPRPQAGRGEDRFSDLHAL
jgi:hypothetical protein